MINTVNCSSIFRFFVVNIKNWSEKASTPWQFDEADVHRIASLELVNRSFLQETRRTCRTTALKRLFNICKFSL